MGVLEERHPGQFAFSLDNRSSPDAQLRTAAPSRPQLILVADELRARGIGLGLKILSLGTCWKILYKTSCRWSSARLR